MDAKAKNLQECYRKLQTEFDDFTYIISHDFKGPLRAISNLADWIVEDLKDNTNPEIVRSLELLQSRTGRLHEMVDAITQLSRVGRRHLDIEQTDIRAAVEEAIEGVHFPPGCVIDIEGSSCTLSTYRYKLKQALGILLDNAASFNTNPEPVVRILIEESDTAVHLRIADNGPGVAAHIEKKLFQIFATTNTESEPPSTGLGLTLGQKIAEFVGGDLTYDASYTEGAAFDLIWPKTIPPLH